MSEENLNEQNQQEQVSDDYNRLLTEFSKSREDLKKMLEDVEQCKNDVLKSVADSSDYRNKYAREERLKTLSTFFQNELQIRQEYNRSLLSEIEVRRKLDMNNSDTLEIDIREIAKQLSKANKNKSE